MTNGERYKTSKERVEAFNIFCASFETCSHGCPLDCDDKHYDDWCNYAWLELEADEEKPMPCLWCKSDMQHVQEGSGHFLACIRCNHTTRKFDTNEELVREYNRIAKAVKEREVRR